MRGAPMRLSAPFATARVGFGCSWAATIRVRRFVENATMNEAADCNPPDSFRIPLGDTLPPSPAVFFNNRQGDGGCAMTSVVPGDIMIVRDASDEPCFLIVDAITKTRLCGPFPRCGKPCSARRIWDGRVRSGIQTSMSAGESSVRRSDSPYASDWAGNSDQTIPCDHGERLSQVAHNSWRI